LEPSLLILALTIAAKSGGSLVTESGRIGISFIVFVTIVLIGIPKLAREFFKFDRLKRSDFHFIILILLATAVLAEVMKIHAIIGAFLAGIALSAGLKYSPDTEPLKDVYFFGKSFFIPIFLIVLGMNTNLSVLLKKPGSLAIAICVVLGLIITKIVAGLLAGKIFNYGLDRSLALGFLTLPQLAVTLAAAIAGKELGIIPISVFDAVVIMSIITSLISPPLVKWTFDRIKTKELHTKQPALK